MTRRTVPLISYGLAALTAAGGVFFMVWALMPRMPLAGDNLPVCVNDPHTQSSLFSAMPCGADTIGFIDDDTGVHLNADPATKELALRKLLRHAWLANPRAGR